jgi:hypothetical protein
MAALRALGAVAGAVIIGVATLLTAGCGHPAPANGYVWVREYDPAWQQYWPGYFVPGYCGRYSCSSGYYIPGYWEYFPEEWKFEMCTESISYVARHGSSKQYCGWRDVDPGTYSRVALGSYYQTQVTVPAPQPRKSSVRP